MKFTQLLYNTSLILTLTLTGVLTSCNKDDDRDRDFTALFDFNFPASIYNNDGYWTDVYNTDSESQNFLVSSVGLTALAEFTHSAQATEWEGVVYRSYTGFCPSRVNDNTDHSNQDWVDYQWAAMASTASDGYLIAHWDTSETADKHSCAVDFGAYARPASLRVTNTAWGYWAMTNGSAFSRPFGADDVCMLTIHGVKGNIETGTVDVVLAANGKIVDNWTKIDLTGLGTCTGMYFTMTSTDSGQWGMNNPAYFAIDELQIVYTANPDL